MGIARSASIEKSLKRDPGKKNIALLVSRRFKRQRRRWTKGGADHLAQWLWFRSHRIFE